MVDHGVLLVSRRRDAEVRQIRSWLSRVGVPTCRLDSDQLDGVAITADPDSRTIRVDGRCFAPTVTWVRHFAMRGTAGLVPDERLMLFRDSWRALARQLDVVSTLLIGGRAPGRMEQHARATALGIRVPRTVVTTDPASAVAAFTAARYVVKALHRHFVEPEPGRFAWFHPVIADAVQLRDGTPFSPAPVLVQEFVPHERELRTYLVGGQIYAYEVSKSFPDDPWVRPETVRVAPAEVPRPVADAVRALAGAWRLSYAAFDFLLDGGVPVFLELDPHGDWCWFERAAGLDRVGVAAARMVFDAHRGTASASAPEILAFLGVTGQRKS